MGNRANGLDFRQGAEITGIGGHRLTNTVNTTGPSETAAVDGHSRIDLVLGADLTTELALTNWDPTSGMQQEVVVHVIQDATGGRLFDWEKVVGTWREYPPPVADLEVDPDGTTLIFRAWTDDDGVTVNLEPIGVIYANECRSVQVSVADVPAVAVAGSLQFGREFSPFADCVLTDLNAGDRVVPDWRFTTPGDLSSDIEVSFDPLIVPFAAGDYQLVMWGEADPCDLTPTLVSEWIPFLMPFTVGAGQTLTPHIDRPTPNGDGRVQFIWDDGSAPENDAVTGATPHTYVAAQSGTVILRHRPGITLSRFDISGDPFFVTTEAVSDAFPELDTVLMRSSVTQTGDVSAFADHPQLRLLYVNDSPITGAIAANLPLWPNLIDLVTDRSDVVTDLAAFSGNSQFTGGISIGDSNSFGDVANLASETSSRRLNLSNNPLITGNLETSATLTQLTLFQIRGTDATGDPTVVLAATPLVNQVELGDNNATYPVAIVDEILRILAQDHAVSNGTLRLEGDNPAPTGGAGNADLVTLQGRGWTVIHN